MPPLSLFSEPYAPTGNMGDGGFQRLLGAPSLEGLQLVLREAVQNSCDAAKLGTGPRILIRLRTLTPQELACARDVVFAQRPFIQSSAEALGRFLQGPTARVLEICDFGSTGLGGPTRADRVPTDVERTDFIDFLRNVGTRRNTDLGGGTYGFGKASLYRASQCSSIIVDTLAHDGAADARRFMACHLGDSGDRSDGQGYLKRYTGRHWWGVPAADGGPAEPMTGDAAAELSRALGAPARDERGDTGTSILILDPDLNLESEDVGPSHIGIHIAECVLWNFWPRMMDSTPEHRRIQLTVEVDGHGIGVPRPEDCPPLDLFARAMNAIRDRSGDVRGIRCEKPSKDLGRLAIVRGLRGDRAPAFRSPGSLLPDRSCHIALMRPAEMVVTYMKGPELPDERTEWAGAFVTSDRPEVEEAFARSEPAAHDAWDPATFPRGHERTFVTVALRRIREAALAVGAPSATPAVGGEASPTMAAVAGRLGAFLEGGGPGGPRRSGRSGGGAATGRRRVTQPVFERLEMREGQRTALFRLAVTGRGRETRLDLTPTVALDGGGVAASALDLDTQLAVTEVRGPGCETFSCEGPVEIGALEGELTVRVTVPDDCAVGLKATLLQEAGS